MLWLDSESKSTLEKHHEFACKKDADHGIRRCWPRRMCRDYVGDPRPVQSIRFDYSARHRFDRSSMDCLLVLQHTQGHHTHRQMTVVSFVGPRDTFFSKKYVTISEGYWSNVQ